MRAEAAEAVRQAGGPAAGVAARALGPLAVGLALLVALVGCAPLQRIPIEAGPGAVELFVDGERVPKTPDSTLELRADRPHVLMFRKAGYRPEQRVLESHAGPDGPTLRPTRVAVELEPLVERERKIEIELDSDEAAAP